MMKHINNHAAKTAGYLISSSPEVQPPSFVPQYGTTKDSSCDQNSRNWTKGDNAPRHYCRKFLLLATAILILALPKATSALSLDIKPPNPVIKIPGLSDFTTPAIDTNPETCPEIYEARAAGCLHVPWIGQYLASLYRNAVLVSTILAVVVMMIAGFIWLTSGGNVSQIGTAKSYIIGAITGLVLMLGSYTILNLINPKLVSFKALRVAVVEKKDLPQVKMLDSFTKCSWKDSAYRMWCPDPDDYLSEDLTKCSGEQGFGQVCCCSGINYDLRTFSMSQKGDASMPLVNLIGCIIEKRGGTEKITVTSISDSNIAAGTCEPWNCTKSPQPNCQHTCQPGRISAHYGGLNNLVRSKTQGGFSCAVDVAPRDGDYAALQQATVTCGANFTQCERNKQVVNCTTGNPDHLHASIGGCGSY